MRLVLHTIICCCLFTTVLPMTQEELNSSLKKRFKIWLQSRMKRDLSSRLVTASEWYSDLQQDKNAIIVPPASSFGLNIRPKRSASFKTTGCSLGTCVYHDLLHELYRINNNPKDAKAPQIKISSTGYGRRRRSLTDVTQRLGRQRRSTEAGQRVPRRKSTCTAA